MARARRSRGSPSSIRTRRSLDSGFDADPEIEWFGCDFYTTRSKFLLFHEVTASVHDSLPPERPMPSGSKDDWVYAQMRPVMVRVCKALADGGAFDQLATAKRFEVGYCYSNEPPFLVCRTLTRKRSQKRPPEPSPAKPARAVEPKRVRAAASTDLPPELSRAAVKRALAKRNAYQALAPYFAPRVLRHPRLSCVTYYALVGVAKLGPPVAWRWIERTLPLLDVATLRGGAIQLLASAATRRARDALFAHARKERDGQATLTLANLGDRRVTPLVAALLHEPSWELEIEQVIRALRSLGDPAAAGPLAQWIAGHRDAASIANRVRAATKTLEALGTVQRR